MDYRPLRSDNVASLNGDTNTTFSAINGGIPHSTVHNFEDSAHFASTVSENSPSGFRTHLVDTSRPPPVLYIQVSSPSGIPVSSTGEVRSSSAPSNISSVSSPVYSQSSPVVTCPFRSSEMISSVLSEVSRILTQVQDLANNLRDVILTSTRVMSARPPPVDSIVSSPRSSLPRGNVEDSSDGSILSSDRSVCRSRESDSVGSTQGDSKSELSGRSRCASRSSHYRRRNRSRRPGRDHRFDSSESSDSVESFLHRYGLSSADFRERSIKDDSVLEPYNLNPVPPSQFLVQVSASDIPSFSGDIEDFQDFRQAFLGFAQAIPAHQRLVMLRLKLTSEAKQVIAGVTGTDEASFHRAFDLLDEKYHRPDQVVEVLLAELWNLVDRPQIQSDAEFRELVSNLTRIHNRLLSLDRSSIGSCGMIKTKLTDILPEYPKGKVNDLMLRDHGNWNFTSILKVCERCVKRLDQQDLTHRTATSSKFRSEHSDSSEHSDHSHSDRKSRSYNRDSRPYYPNRYSSRSPDRKPIVSRSSNYSVGCQNSSSDCQVNEVSVGKGNPSDVVKRSAVSYRLRSPSVGHSSRSASNNSRRSDSRSQSTERYRCMICLKNDHSSLKCTVICPDLKHLAFERQLCFVCLTSGHRSELCPVKEFLNESVICTKSSCSMKSPHCAKLCETVSTD